MKCSLVVRCTQKRTFTYVSELIYRAGQVRFMWSKRKRKRRRRSRRLR
jgi:hypothetical protein